ncbi:MAG: hypothetical protein ACI94O_000858 [Octadecabacter sp.]|jgi:hypothetical protein
MKLIGFVWAPNGEALNRKIYWCEETSNNIAFMSLATTKQQ